MLHKFYTNSFLSLTCETGKINFTICNTVMPPSFNNAYDVQIICNDITVEIGHLRLLPILRTLTYHLSSLYHLYLGRNLRFCCRRFGCQLEDFLLGFVSLDDDRFHNFCMNNIPVAQLQIASLVEELLGFVTFNFSNIFSKSVIIVLLNVVCIEWWRRVI